MVDLSKIGSHQTFLGAVSPAEHGGDNVASPALNPSAIGDEHGHVITAALNPAALGGEHAIDSLATGSSAGTSADADVGGLPIENGLSSAFTHVALSSLLNVLTSDQAMVDGDHGAGSTVQTAQGGDHAIDSLATGSSAGTSADADVGGLPIENGLSSAFTHVALSSLLNVHTSDQPMVDGDHGKGSTVQTAQGGDHATVPTIGTQSSSTALALGADNFVFHPNLGNNNIHETSTHTTDAGSISSQNGPQPSGLAVSVHELAPEFLIDYAHHDAADVSATVSQFPFQQMASSAHLLH